MELEAKAEKSAAEAALSEWKEMLAKAVQVDEGSPDVDLIKDRIKSLDAAWARFDKAHNNVKYKLCRKTINEADIEQENWEEQLKKYYASKEDGIAALRKLKVIL